MTIKIHKLVQGSSEWHAFRAEHDTASEASAMMGAKPNATRTELLRLKATGSEKEFSAWVQKHLLDKGHVVEASARPLAELVIGEALYPVTVTNSDYPGKSASLDGIVEDYSAIWECKSWNEAKAAQAEAGSIPEEDLWQVVQQLMLSGAETCLYTVTDGTPERTKNLVFSASQSHFKQLQDGWQQFNYDKADYEHVASAPQVVGEAVEALPAVFAKVTGQVSVQDNFSSFEKALRHFLAEVLITEPTTDQDFADLDLQIKALKKAEAALDAAETQMLAQVQEVNSLKTTKDMLSELVRKNRILAEKLLATKKEELKLAIRQSGEKALADFIVITDQSFEGRARMPAYSGNFAVVMKGKRTISSLQDAVDTELARCKIEVNNTAERIHTNLASLREIATGYEFLFRDRLELVLKENESLVLIARQRVTDHKKAEEEKIETARVEAVRVERERADKEVEDKKKSAEAELEASAPQPDPLPQEVVTKAVTKAEDQPAAQPVKEVAGPVETQADTQKSVVTLISAKALLRGVADGVVPMSVITIDMAALTLACEQAGFALPGTTWSRE